MAAGDKLTTAKEIREALKNNTLNVYCYTKFNPDLPLRMRLQVTPQRVINARTRKGTLEVKTLHDWDWHEPTEVWQQ